MQLFLSLTSSCFTLRVRVFWNLCYIYFFCLSDSSISPLCINSPVLLFVACKCSCFFPMCCLMISFPPSLLLLRNLFMAKVVCLFGQLVKGFCCFCFVVWFGFNTQWCLNGCSFKHPWLNGRAVIECGGKISDFLTSVL